MQSFTFTDLKEGNISTQVVTRLMIPKKKKNLIIWFKWFLYLLVELLLDYTIICSFNLKSKNNDQMPMILENDIIT